MCGHISNSVHLLPNMPRLSVEIEAKSSHGFEVGFGTQQTETDCQNDVQNDVVFYFEGPYYLYSAGSVVSVYF